MKESSIPFVFQIGSKYDVDYFEFVLPDGHDTIAIDFDLLGADDPGNDKWDIEFYDTSGSNTAIASKEFIFSWALT